MKQLLFRISVALLTFTMGITIASVWIIRHYFLPSTIAPSTAVKPSVLTKSSLPCAVTQWDIATVKELLASGVNVDSTADDCIMAEPSPRGETLLMQSAYLGKTEIVNLLLENGANVNASDSWGDTPLSCAVGGKHIEIIGLLLEKGANINARDEADRTPLMSAAGEGDLEVIEYLLDKGADINAKDANGTTALMFAAGFKQPEAMSFLLKRGANPSLKDRHGRTASVYARRGFPNEYLILKR